jgi:Zn2+/Cd2+-exporting ATPase
MDRMLKRILLSSAIFAVGLSMHYLTDVPSVYQLPLFLVGYAVIGIDVVYDAVRKVLRGQMLDEDFLMFVATAGAFLIGYYPEAMAVMLFFRIGELIEERAVERSRGSISALMDVQPEFANRRTGDTVERVSPSEVSVGDVVIVKPGEKVPLDGVVVSGSSSVDARALTGESAPVDVRPEDKVLSGCINLNGTLEVLVEKEYDDSTVARVLELVETASSRKSRSEKFITSFARWYTPAVVLGAVAVATVPPLVLGGGWEDWIYRALIFLVVSCPCAFVLSVPLTFFCGVGCASRCGILVKGTNYLEALAKADTVVFDKTGTLTEGVFEVSRVDAVGMDGDALLEMTARAESFSNHPISASVRAAFRGEIGTSGIGRTEEIAGKGVIAEVDGMTVHAGNSRLMDDIGVDRIEDDVLGTPVHVAIDGRYAGRIIISDAAKEDARGAVGQLHSMGIRTVMLTGDADAAGRRIAADLGIDEVHTQLLPGDKVDRMEEIMASMSKGRTLAYVGDGINDAPVLARSDVGIAMGGMGSDAAIEAADLVIMTDEPSKVVTAVRIARRTRAIVWQNVAIALSVKFGVLALTVLGYANMWEGVFADVGVTAICIVNGIRAMNTAKVLG